MKKWIGFLAALLLAVVTGPVFADHIEPVQPKGIADEEAKKHFKKGVEAFREDKFDEAVIHFQAAEQEDPTTPETHVNLAMALAAAGQTEEAEKHFDQASNLIAQAESPEMIPQG
jgi:Flp pilus assembly protein TadD